MNRPIAIYDSLEGSEGLPEPDVLAAEIVEDLPVAMAQFREIARNLEGEVEGIRDVTV